MLHVLLIAVFGVLALREQGGDGFAPPGLEWFSHSTIAALSVGTMVALLVVLKMVAWATGRALDRRGDLGSIARMDWMVSITRVTLVVVHAINVLLLGWLDVLRAWKLDFYILDQVLAVAPVMLALAAIWVVVYPVERRLRDAMVLESLDSGRSVHATPGVMRYVWLAVRHQMLPVVVPGMLVMALHPIIESRAQALGTTAVSRELWGLGLQLACFGLMMMFMPVLLTRLWSTVPLASGPVSERLMALCAVHRVKIRKLLVWHTDGTMVNGAVVGFVGWARYILLTDELLERLPSEHVEAVMAHEVAHVRRRHIAWLVVTLFAGLGLGTIGAGVLAQLIWPRVLVSHSLGATLVQIGVQLVGVVVGVLVFGWVSRRFEWQADAFAVSHMSQHASVPSANVTPEASATMVAALESVARLNHIPLRRFTFRHGSIATRMRKLRELAGKPAARLPIDGVVRWIKIVAGVALAMMIGLMIWESLSVADTPLP